jgi:hypothetical protein
VRAARLAHTTRRAVAVLSVTLAALVGASLAVAAFSATTTNSANTFATGTWGCLAPGSQTLTATSDAYVHLNTATSNYGSSPDLYVESDSGDGKMRTLVRYNLPSVASGCVVTAAKLRLYAYDADSGRTLAAYRAAAAWSEGAVTWNTQPATAGSATTVSSAWGWREWDVTQHVLEQYLSGNYGFVIRDAAEASGSDRSRFYSRESSSNQPQLVVTFG